MSCAPKFMCIAGRDQEKRQKWSSSMLDSTFGKTRSADEAIDSELLLPEEYKVWRYNPYLYSESLK